MSTESRSSGLERPIQSATRVRQCFALPRQAEFFATHLQPWVNAMCDAIAAHPRARFYAVLSRFTRAFASVEAQGFDML